MRIVHYSNIDFDIDRQGKLSRKSTWHVMPDEIDLAAWPGWADAVREWAGNPGDPWRRPDAGSESFTADPACVVTAIDFKAKARYMYEVTFTGQPAGLTAVMLGQPELSVSENGEREKSAKWLLHANLLEDFLPAPGSVLVWAGELYLCGRVDCRDSGGGRYEVTVKARDMARLMVGLPTFRRNTALESVRSAKWRVIAAEAESFIAENNIGADASAWAGDGYHVISLRGEPNGLSGYYFTLEARHTAIRMTDLRKSIRYLRNNETGGTVIETVCTGRWQIHRDYLEEFENRCGQSAEDWAGTDYIVISVEPVRVSEMEYQVSMEARIPSAVTRFAPMTYDDRSNLSSRRDVSSSWGEFKLTPEQCGWTRQGEEWVKLNDLEPETWKSGRDCPLRTTEELNWSLSETPLSAMIVEVTEYWHGQVSRHVASLARWDESGEVLSGYTLCGSTGSWRKIDQQADQILDNNSDVWTRVYRTYQKSPGSFLWNPGFTGFAKQP